MKNIRHLGKTGLILLGIVWLGFSFSGCGLSSVILQWILLFTFLNTLILAGCLVCLIYHVFIEVILSKTYKYVRIKI